MSRPVHQINLATMWRVYSIVQDKPKGLVSALETAGVAHYAALPGALEDLGIIKRVRVLGSRGTVYDTEWVGAMPSQEMSDAVLNHLRDKKDASRSELARRAGSSTSWSVERLTRIETMIERLCAELGVEVQS